MRQGVVNMEGGEKTCSDFLERADAGEINRRSQLTVTNRQGQGKQIPDNLLKLDMDQKT